MSPQMSVPTRPGSRTGRSVFAMLAALGLAATLGVVAIVVGGIGTVPYEAPLFPAIRRGVEGLNAMTLLLLGDFGFALGRFSKTNPLALGLAMVAPLPLAASLEMRADPTSHNLWPIEFALYGILSVVPIGGAVAGWGLRILAMRLRTTD